MLDVEVREGLGKLGDSDEPQMNWTQVFPLGRAAPEHYIDWRMMSRLDTTSEGGLPYGFTRASQRKDSHGKQGHLMLPSTATFG